jgi:hypothetical protein
MAKETIASKVEKHFASNPPKKEVHATSDGFLFERKENANVHAKTLKDKNVQTFTKSGKVENIDAVDLSDAEKEAAKVEADKKVAAAKKKAAEAKKQAEATKKASENTAGAKKHPANTGADQKTAK